MTTWRQQRRKLVLPYRKVRRMLRSLTSPTTRIAPLDAALAAICVVPWPRRRIDRSPVARRSCRPERPAAGPLLAALVLAIGAGAATPAAAHANAWSERAGDRPATTVEVTGDSLPPECATWARWMSYQLALHGIFGAQADSYIAQRRDYSCHRPITGRSLFHAGDPS